MTEDRVFDTDEQMTEYLNRDGNLRVPCSRYGHDTFTCTPVAVRLASLIADANGTETTAESLDHLMGLVVNDHQDVQDILTEHGRTPDDYELAAYECSICGEPHNEETHGEPLVMRDTGRDTLVGFVGTVLSDALVLVDGVPSVGDITFAGRVYRLMNEWEALTDDERDEYAPEYLDDIDTILSDAGLIPVNDGDQGTWCVYAPVPVDVLS